MQQKPPVSRLVAASYALPAFVLALLGVTYYVYVPKFYGDVLHVNLTLLGVLIFVSRVWDAVTDPLIGVFSDRTQTRFGRRKPWIALSALPLAFVFLLILSPPTLLSPHGALLWLAITSFFFFLFWTSFSVPYEALGAELSDSYDERTKLLGLRDGILILGTFCSAIFPVLVTKWAAVENGREQFFLLGTVYAFLALLLTLPLCLFAKERVLAPSQLPKSSIGSLIGSWASLKQNTPFRVLLFAYTLGAFGAALPGTLIFFYVEYVLQSANAASFLALYFGVGILSLPLWIVLARRIGKKEAWIGAMLVNTGSFLFALLLGPGDEIPFAIVTTFSALGYGATLALPSSMQADTIDYDEFLTGQRREGEIIGIWSIFKKLASALGAGIAFPLLDLAGYVPNVAQSPFVQSTLTFLYAGLPCLCNIGAIAIAQRYSLSRIEHEAMRGAIALRSVPPTNQPQSDVIPKRSTL